MLELDTVELLARLAEPGAPRLAAIAELARRREPAASRPLIGLLRGDLAADEQAAVLAALELVGHRAILPLLQHIARARPELAERLAAVREQLQRPAPATEPGLRWVAVGGGRLAIGPRPKVRALAELRAGGATHLVTLLCDTEGAQSLGDAAADAGLAWLWLPLRNGDPPASAHDPAMRATFDAWAALLADGAALYLHCAAGIHRTGMITHALLRRTGHAPGAALRLLSELRPLTAAEAGDARIAWGHRFAAP